MLTRTTWNSWRRISMYCQFQVVRSLTVAVPIYSVRPPGRRQAQLTPSGMFPIRERGVNHLAQPLTAAEINAMSNDPEISKRQLRAYTMVRPPDMVGRVHGADTPDVAVLRHRLQRRAACSFSGLAVPLYVRPSQRLTVVPLG